MPTDIVTLAIECKTKDAVNGLNKLNDKLDSSRSLAIDVAKNLGIAFGSASVIAYMKSAISQSIEFNQQLYNIKSIAGELNLKKVSDELISLDSRLGRAADNAGAFYFAYSAGVRGTEKELVNFTSQIGKLSQAIVAGQVPTMDAVTSVMNAYGIKTGEVSEITDMFFQIIKQGKTTGSQLANAIGAIAGVASNAGVSLNDLGNAIATLTTTMPTERAITSLSGMITAFIKPTDAAKKAAAKYGIELSAASLKAKGLSGILTELNSKVGTNTEAIAEIVPSIEGMRAAVALAGGQYEMFANNMEIFANKGGSAAKAFEDQAQNLDKQITSLPVTINKINIEMGEMVKDILSLKGALTPLLSTFNSMDKESLKLTANIGLAVGGLVLYKGAIATINTISMARSALQAVAISQTQKETAALNSQTAAYMALNSAKGKTFGQIPSNLSGASTISKHTEWDRADIQRRWDARREHRQTRNMQTNVMPGLVGSTGGNVREVAVNANELGASTRNAAQSLKNLDSTMNKLPTNVNIFNKAIGSVGGALTGGAKGFAGFANALSGVAAAVPIAIGAFKLGGNLRQKFDVWMGWEEGEEKALERGAEAERRIKEIRAQRAAAAQKNTEDAQKKAENDAERLKLVKKERKMFYDDMSVQQQIFHDRKRLNELQQQYREEQRKSKSDFKKMNELADEISVVYKRISEKEKLLNVTQQQLRDIYISRYSETGNIQLALKLNEEAIATSYAILQKAEKENLQASKPEEYNNLIQRRISELNTQRRLVNQMKADENKYFNLQLQGVSSNDERRKLLQNRIKVEENEMKRLAQEGDKTGFDEAMERYMNLNQKYAELSKSTRKYFNGIVTTSQGLRFGSLEAYREQRKIYETRPSDDRNDKVIRRNAANKVIALLPVLKKTLDTIANNTEKGVGNGSVTFQAR